MKPTIHFFCFISFQKKYDACIQLFPRFDLKAQYLNSKEAVEFVLRSGCHSLSKSEKPKAEHKVSIANGFTAVFSQLAEISAYDKIFTIMNLFTSVKDFERVLPKFTEMSPSEFDIESWLQAARTYLFQALNNANIIDNSAQTKQKEIYVKLTRVLLFFVNAEAQRTVFTKGHWEFTESKRFLDCCVQFKLFQEGDEQYTECFKLLNQYLDCLSTEDKNAQLATNLQKFIKKSK